ncbi:MAG TPA: WXG100 family type VII secretion target [Actinopolymorphaceae bacterium]|jgi:WXG100 family type VII secretion target
MSDYTQWDSASLQNLYANLKSAHAAVEQETQDLEQTLEAKLGEWTGDAREAYRQAKATWDKSVDDMNQVLLQLGNAIQQVEESYVGTERANQSLFT